MIQWIQEQVTTVGKARWFYYGLCLGFALGMLAFSLIVFQSGLAFLLLH